MEIGTWKMPSEERQEERFELSKHYFEVTVGVLTTKLSPTSDGCCWAKAQRLWNSTLTFSLQNFFVFSGLAVLWSKPGFARDNLVLPASYDNIYAVVFTLRYFVFHFRILFFKNIFFNSLQVCVDLECVWECCANRVFKKFNFFYFFAKI